MCDNCEKDLVEQEPVQEEEMLDEKIVSLSLDKEYDRLSRRFLFDDESVDILAQTDEFIEGQKQALKLCGMYSTLVSFGIDEDKVFELVINQQTIDHNLINSKLTSDMNIEMSKNQLVNLEKNQL